MPVRKGTREIKRRGGEKDEILSRGVRSRSFSSYGLALRLSTTRPEGRVALVHSGGNLARAVCPAEDIDFQSSSIAVAFG